MEGKLSSFKWNNGILAIVCLVLGISFLIWPIEVLQTGSKLIGIAVLMGAIGNIIHFALDKYPKTSSDIFYFIISLISIGISISIFVNPTWIIATINIFVGIVLIMNGCSNISNVVAIKSDDKIWWAFVIVPFITIACGFVIMSNPIQMASLMTRI